MKFMTACTDLRIKSYDVQAASVTKTVTWPTYFVFNLHSIQHHYTFVLQVIFPRIQTTHN